MQFSSGIWVKEGKKLCHILVVQLLRRTIKYLGWIGYCPRLESGTPAHNLGMPSWSGDRKNTHAGRRLSTRQGTQEYRGGRRLLLPLHPHQSQVPPAAQIGGGKPSYRTMETRRGHWLAVSWRFGDFCWTDDGWLGAAGGGRPTEQTRTERRQRKKRERIRANCTAQGTRVTLGEGVRGGGGT